MEEAAKEEEASTEEGGDDMDSNEPDADVEAASAQVYLDLSIGIIMACLGMLHVVHSVFFVAVSCAM